MSNRSFDDDDDRGGRPDKRKTRSSRNYKANNEGGYGNPPVSGQFKRGGRGGPGRRRGTTSLGAALSRMFASKVPVSINGQSISLSMADAMAECLRREILSGNFKALDRGFELMKLYGPIQQSNELPMYDLTKLPLEQKRALRALLATARSAERREVFRLLKQGKAWHDAKRKEDDTDKD